MKGDISPQLAAGTLLFSGYGEDYLQLHDTRYNHSLIIHHNTPSAWAPTRLEALEIAHFAPLLERPPEVLLLGTGRTTRFPDAAILDWMAEHHIGFECMDSRSAARTYNILIEEGRTVSIAMLLPGIG